MFRRKYTCTNLTRVFSKRFWFVAKSTNDCECPNAHRHRSVSFIHQHHTHLRSGVRYILSPSWLNLSCANFSTSPPIGLRMYHVLLHSPSSRALTPPLFAPHRTSPISPGNHPPVLTRTPNTLYRCDCVPLALLDALFQITQLR